MTICPICNSGIYQCERCGGTGKQESGNYWNGKQYVPELDGKCNDCDGKKIYEHENCLAVEMVQNRLKSYPLYHVDHKVRCNWRDEILLIGYQSGLGNSRIGQTYFNAQIEKGIFYILTIEIEKQHRGQGLGEALYNILEFLAKDFNCYKIVMTPSGWTNTGETRQNYVCRKLGYQSEGIIAVKILESRMPNGD